MRRKKSLRPKAKGLNNEQKFNIRCKYILCRTFCAWHRRLSSSYHYMILCSNPLWGICLRLFSLALLLSYYFRFFNMFEQGSLCGSGLISKQSHLAISHGRGFLGPLRLSIPACRRASFSAACFIFSL